MLLTTILYKLRNVFNEYNVVYTNYCKVNNNIDNSCEITIKIYIR